MKCLTQLRMLSLAMITALLGGACSSDLIEQVEEQPTEEKGEIRTLVFGLPRTQETRSLLGPQSLADTRTAITLETDGSAKVNWSENDRIVLLKGTTQYKYKLISTGENGKGVFEAEGAALPDLTGNTDNIYVYHFGSDEWNYSSGELVTNHSFSGFGFATQEGNDNSDHLKKNTVLKLDVGPATSAAAIAGTLEPVNTVMSFEIAAPAGLESGELPIDVVLTNKRVSGSSYFMEYAALYEGGILKVFDDSPSYKLRKNGVHLRGITEWNASNPLKAHFNVMLGGTQDPSDVWYLEVQTNKGNIWLFSFSTTVTIEGGKRYVTPITNLTKAESCPAETSACLAVNSIAANLEATFNATDYCCPGYTYIVTMYTGIQWSKVPTFDDGSMQLYGVSDGKGSISIGTGSLVTSYAAGVPCDPLEPNTTYYYRAYKEVDGGMIYYGQPKQFTTLPLNIITDNESGVDLGGSVIWDVMNLGASKVEEYGNYYAWGVEEANDVFSQSGYYYGSFKDAATAVNSSKRVPTDVEFSELKTLPYNDEFVYNEVKGLLFVGWNNNAIFFPYAGYKHEGTYANKQEKEAYYWSSTAYDDTKACILRTDSSYDFWIKFGSYTQPKYDGCPIRPVRDRSSE